MDAVEADNPFNQAKFEQPVQAPPQPPPSEPQSPPPQAPAQVAVQAPPAQPTDSTDALLSTENDASPPNSPMFDNRRKDSDAYESSFWNDDSTGLGHEPAPRNNGPDPNGVAYSNRESADFMQLRQTAYNDGQIAKNNNNNNNNKSNSNDNKNRNNSNSNNSNNSNSSANTANATLTTVKKGITNLFKKSDNNSNRDRDSDSNYKQQNNIVPRAATEMHSPKQGFDAYRHNANQGKYHAHITHAELDKIEKNLKKREKQLTQRQERLDKVQTEFSAPDARRDNWPCKYYPIAFHSIQQEIPPHARSHMRRLYTLVLLSGLTFFWNCFAMLALYFTSVVKDDELLLSVLYLFCGVVGAWRLWYRQIYYALRDRKVIRWWVFFFFFFCHIGFSGVMAIGLDGWGGAGYATMINAFNDVQSSFAGICNLVAAILWTIVFLGSIWYFKKSYHIYKQRTGVEDIQQTLHKAAIGYAVEHAVDRVV